MSVIGGKVATHTLQQVVCSGVDLATGEEHPHAKEQETHQPQQLHYLESAIQASRGRGPPGTGNLKKKWDKRERVEEEERERRKEKRDEKKKKEIGSMRE